MKTDENTINKYVIIEGTSMLQLKYIHHLFFLSSASNPVQAVLWVAFLTSELDFMAAGI